MIRLDEDQKKAAETKSLKSLVVAGAGSGKTRTLIARINRLVSLGEEPKGIACITYTNSAAKTIKGRLNEDIGFVGTLHSFVFSQIRKMSASLSILPEEDAKSILKEEAKKSKYGTVDIRKLSDLRREWWQSKPEPGSRPDNAQRLMMNYDARLATMGCIDYDGILDMGYGVISSGVDLLPFRHLLVDEFQDSAAIDIAIYNLMSCLTVFFVGDPNQAIFGFRGGDVGHMLDILNDDEFEVCGLTNNYRSTKQICEFANSVGGDDFDGHISPMKSKVKGKGEVRVVPLETEADEMHFIAGSVRNYLNDGESTQAILTRTNRQAYKIRRQMEEMGIECAGGKSSELPRDWWKVGCILSIALHPENRSLNEIYLRKSNPSIKPWEITEKLNELPVISLAEFANPTDKWLALSSVDDNS